MRTRAGGKRYEPEAGTRKSRLAARAIGLKPAPTSFDVYVESVQKGNLLYLSGMLATVDFEPMFVGKIGRESNDCDGN